LGFFLLAAWLSSLVESGLIFLLLLACFFPPGAAAFLILAFDSFSTANLSGLMLQKVAPKFLITDGDRVGGFKEQPRQFLLEQGEFL
jgi:hypothetical protein